MTKYRGWTIDTKREVKGYYCKVEVEGVCYHYIIPKDAKGRINTYGEKTILGFIEVDPKTVGQYIGIRDKKRTKKYPEGQEIYGSIPIDGKMSKGGDIVKHRDGYGKDVVRHPSVVKWNDKGFYQLWRNGLIHWKIWQEDAYYNTSHRKDLEVIGNQTDDPELLEAKK